MKSKILEALHSTDRHVSGEALAKKLRVSRTTVWKHMRSLRKEGYKITSSKQGYRLLAAPDLLLPYEIEEGLKTTVLGRKIVYLRETGSTNDEAKKLAAKGSPEGTLVIAERQTKGKGRLGRAWFSPDGGIWLSIILCPKIAPTGTSKIALLAGIAVARAIAPLGLNAKLKWPNDVLINERKVCGVLTEIDAELEKVNYLVVGIGVNANFEPELFPEEFSSTATTLKHELGKEISRVEFVQRLLEELEMEYEAFNRGKFTSLLSEWKRLSSTLGARVRVVTADRTIEGVAEDIDKDGALLVRADGKIERIVSGDCVHLR